jgi:ribosomal protein L11 methyltransferase
LTLELAAEDVPRAEALLTLAGAETLSLRDAADAPVYEPEPNATPLWPKVVVEALFGDDVDVEHLRSVVATAFSGEATLDVLEESVWTASLAQNIKPRPVGTRLWLASADDASVPDDRLVLRLHMGLAFGTGEHPTTALCLDWLERHVSSGMTVLDYGCGSGVLGLAALTLGAGFVYAVDNDSQALLATKRNAALNGLTHRLFVGAPETLPSVTVDVLAANILAGPLIGLAPTFSERLAPGGMLVLSGILERQASNVVTAYAPRFDAVEQTTRDGWVLLTARRTGVKSGQNR